MSHSIFSLGLDFLNGRTLCKIVNYKSVIPSQWQRNISTQMSINFHMLRWEKLHLASCMPADGITDSMHMSWGGSRSWWWTVKPGMLQSIGLQRVGRNWVTELIWTSDSVVKNLPANAGDAAFIAGLGRSPEMTTHSHILDWKISWTEDPGGLWSRGSQRTRHDWAHSCLKTKIFLDIS